jgi:hypothetical protein
MQQVLEKTGAGEGNRTLVFSLEGCCSTIELHPLVGDQLSCRAGGLNRYAPRPVTSPDIAGNPQTTASKGSRAGRSALTSFDSPPILGFPSTNERR